MNLKKKICGWLQHQGILGKLLLSLLKFVMDIIRHYPFYRCCNFLHYTYLILIRRCRPLKLDARIHNKEFYLCRTANEDESLMFKIPHLNNDNSCDFFKGLRSSRAFNEYSQILYALSNDPILGKHCSLLKKVNKGGGYISSYVDGYNLVMIRFMLQNDEDLPADLSPSDLIKAIDELLESLSKFENKNGKITGNWGLDNLIYEKTTKKIKNVDLNDFYMYQSGQLESNLQYIEICLNFLKEIMEMQKRREPEDVLILRTLSVLGYVTNRPEVYSGLRYPAGYHSFILRGRYFRGQRDCGTRLANVPYDFTGKVVLDMGCNTGGMLHYLANSIKKGIGVDFSSPCINAANSVKTLNNINNLQFFTANLSDKDGLRLIDDFILDNHIDIIFLLSVCMWLPNWKEVIAYTAQKADVLLFESNGDEEQRKEQEEFLHICFSEVTLLNIKSEDDFGQKDRSLFLCKGALSRKPVVSIIVPIYNRVQYLEQAIDSILNQNYTDFEVIIIDDGSTENIKEILTKCVNKAPSQIRYIQQLNQGPAGARNRGIKEARGEYIAFLDADDEWETEFLNKSIEKLKKGKYKWLDTAAYRVVVNDKEEILQRTIIHAEPIEGIDVLYSLLLKDNVIGSPSKVIVEKECFEKAGYFREDLRIREDWEMWLRLAKAHFKFCRIAQPLYQYKIRQNSLTKTESLKGWECTYRLLRDYAQDAFKLDASNRTLYAENMWNIARHVLSSKKKDFPLFFKSLIKSQLYDPSLTRVLKSLSSLKKRYA